MDRSTAEPAARVVIAHLSDLHVGAHHSSVVDSLVADVHEADPTLTVITGDLTMRARCRQFVQASALLARLPTPQLVVLGNHDLPLAPASRFKEPYTRYRTHIEMSLDPLLEIPGLCAVGLNSMPRWRWKAGRVSPQQCTLVTATFGRAVPAAVRLVALHHPLSHRGPGGVLGRGGLIQALMSAQVDLVLAGHTHRPAVHQLALEGADSSHPVLEVTAGTATSRRDRGAGRSWTLIRFDGDTIHVSERNHTPSGWRRRDTSRHPRRSH